MRNLCLGFDAKRLFFNHTGLGNYSRTLVGSLAKFHSALECQLYAQGRLEKSDFYENFQKPPFKIIQPTQSSKLWRQKGIVKDIMHHRPNIFHGLSAELPLGIKKLTKVKSVVTVHDLIYEYRPKDYSLLDRKLYRSKTKQACQSADTILAISQWTKESLQEFYGIDSDKITVIHQSCLKEFYEVEESDCDLQSPAILMMGGTMERKNLDGFIKAINLIDPQIKFKINMLGEPAAKERAKILSKVKGELRSRVQWNKVHSTRELIDLFVRSSFTVYPSLLEGFGIPIPESFLCNRAVICGKHSALKEAGGQGAHYVDTENPKELAEGMVKLLGDSTYRKNLVRKGKTHALSMNQEVYCTQLREMYKSML